MQNKADVIIVGGGLAGLTAAIHLTMAGKQVILFEKKAYPQHKVCGEYISNEIRPYFQSLNIHLEQLQPHDVKRFKLHSPNGQSIEAPLPLGGIGIRRYRLDEWLCQHAQQLGAAIKTQAIVQDIQFDGHHFTVILRDQSRWTAPFVMGSFGKRSNLDKTIRNQPIRPSSFVGVKFYSRIPQFPDDLVTLFNFEGGYGGAVKVEDGTVDIAYLTRSEAIKTAGDLRQLESNMLKANPAFRSLLEAPRITPTPLTISNISFAPKQAIENHILLVGDAAGMIPPLCGNGMAMGIHAAKLASDSIVACLSKKITRAQMERQYQYAWKRKFQNRLFWGRTLHPFMLNSPLANVAVRALKQFPGLLPIIIRQTHGQPF